MTYVSALKTPLGDMLAASDGDSLTGLWFMGQQHFGSAMTSETSEKDLPVFDLAKSWLGAYFAGEIPDFTPPVKLMGTPFQQAVWLELLNIPYGSTATYGKIAARLGGTSPRAVGGAVGRNPISLIVPCHRVIGAEGGITGYAGGVERKVWLLRLEAETRKNLDLRGKI